MAAVQRLHVLICVLGVLVAAGCVALVWSLSHPRGAGGLTDAETVYCLDPAHAPALVRAGAELGVVNGVSDTTVTVSGSALSPAAWRAHDASGFDRACAAIAQTALPSAATAKPAASANTLTALIPVAFGAVLTWIVSTVQAGRAARGKAADGLRERWREFSTAVFEYVDARNRALNEFDDAPMKAAWQSLREMAEGIVGAHHSWKDAEALQKLLEDGLSPGRLAVWPSSSASPQKRSARQAEAIGLASAGSVLAERLAAGLANPLRRPWNG